MSKAEISRSTNATRDLQKGCAARTRVQQAWANLVNCSVAAERSTREQSPLATPTCLMCPHTGQALDIDEGTSQNVEA